MKLNKWIDGKVVIMHVLSFLSRLRSRGKTYVFSSGFVVVDGGGSVING